MNSDQLLRRTLELAELSLLEGNLPFGCLLADKEGNTLLEEVNTVITAKDPIGHCEINLVHTLKDQFTAEELSECMLYASTEPCPMCAAAVFWSGIGHIAFALDKDQYHEIAGTTHPAHIMDLKAQDLLQYGRRKVYIIGPLLEKEAIAFYQPCMQSGE